MKTRPALSKESDEKVKTELEPHVRRKFAKGRCYFYFDTGEKTPGGGRKLTPLPEPGEAGYTVELRKAQLARWRRETTSLPSNSGRRAFGLFSPDLLNRPATGDDLYFIRAGDAVKIGRAADVFRRMVNMQTNNHLELDCVCRLRGRGHEEHAWHVYFQAHHIRGDWFWWMPDIERAIGLARKDEQWWNVTT